MKTKNDHYKTTSLENRRTGKVARLPKDIREIVNRLIEDGCTYLYIIKRLEELGHPGFLEHNISRWRTGGYQSWLQEQENRCLREEEARELHLNRLRLTELELALITEALDQLFANQYHTK